MELGVLQLPEEPELGFAASRRKVRKGLPFRIAPKKLFP